MKRSFPAPRARRRGRLAFDLDRQIELAWHFCWDAYCVPTRERRLAAEMTIGDIFLDSAGDVRQVERIDRLDGQTMLGTDRGPYTVADGDELRLAREWEPRQTWLTATDLEHRVRAAAAEIVDGAPTGSYGRDVYMHGARIGGVGLGGLLGRCRDWLRDKVARGVIRAYHPSGRGATSCSGLRFVPASSPTTAAERRAESVSPEERAKRLNGACHLANADGRPCCGFTKKPTRAFYRRQRTTRMTKDPARVTCARCLKLFADLDDRSRGEMVAQLTGIAPIAVVVVPRSEGGDQ